ncbi:MAG: hypothetical protein ACE5OP_05330 [Candidatus Glassbacteria bacterium]
MMRSAYLSPLILLVLTGSSMALTRMSTDVSLGLQTSPRVLLATSPLSFVSGLDRTGNGRSYLFTKSNAAQEGSPQPSVITPIPVYKPVLFSALLPGAGQLYRGQKRGFAYIATEVVSITAWAFFRNEGNNNEDKYIDFARVNARETVASHDPWYALIQDRIHPELEGDWDYYEHMSQYRRSGRYDRDLNNDFTITGDLHDLDPETEYTDSFNNRQWNIARINFFHTDPENPDALIGTSADTLAAKEYYATTATSFDFAWDWGSPEESGTANMNQYKRIIDDANSAFRRASLSLGLLLANHVVSVIDSYISVKTHNSRIGGKDGLGVRLTPGASDGYGPRARIQLVRRF